MPMIDGSAGHDAARWWEAATHHSASAAACRSLAAEVRSRRRMVTERHRDAVAHHRADIWCSAAAEASRHRLGYEVGTHLWRAGEQLDELARRLDERAGELTARAVSARRRASELAEPGPPATPESGPGWSRGRLR